MKPILLRKVIDYRNAFYLLVLHPIMVRAIMDEYDLSETKAENKLTKAMDDLSDHVKRHYIDLIPGNSMSDDDQLFVAYLLAKGVTYDIATMEFVGHALSEFRTFRRDNSGSSRAYPDHWTGIGNGDDILYEAINSCPIEIKLPSRLRMDFHKTVCDDLDI